ncbi:hypothetical protein E2L08_07145 [Palleronia sediminis]|uniref:Uncharacterized protein n=1 Tax=Palleronia sediminis TaxID=2547833 RepID=A0A4R6AD47_9RHOB|nr:hypothetical protein [Palleronia sediminis]TDL81107.1 hypothetical protein E2L08_07145 [Palleronia sediminis]
MQFVPSTAIVLAVALAMILRGPDRGLSLLFAMLPFGMMAAINLPAVGGTSIVAADLAVVTLVLLVLARPGGTVDLARTMLIERTGVVLSAVLLYAIIATLFLPRVFAGAIEVFSIGRGDGIISRPLRPGNGNLSQLLRLMLSIAAFAAVAAVLTRRPDARAVLRGVQLATGVHVALGLVDIATNAAGLAFLLDPIRTANYSLTLGQKMAGLNRMIGGFPEASAYGYLSLGLFGFWLSYWFTDDGRRGRSGVWLALTTFVLLRGTSSSAYVGAALLLGVFVAIQLRGADFGALRLRAAGIAVIAVAVLPLAVAGMLALYVMVPDVAAFIDRSLLDKLQTSSGVERMSWNAQAFGNFLDTNLMGAGLGSVRASNWLISTLATLGVIGTALMLMFLWRVATLPTADMDRDAGRVAVACKFACAGFLARALVVKATPNLEIAFFVMAGAAVGLCSAAAWARAPASTPRLGAPA